MMLAFPPFRIDTDEERLWKGDKQLTLRRKPFAILRYLVANPKKLVTHDELLAHVWGGAAVSESAVRSHLHELRQVLGDGVIETVIGRGYRFAAELSSDVQPPAAQVARPADALVVGRDAELAVLQGALERAVAGRRQVCFVTGEPGIGKTTLVETFLGSLDPRTVIFGRGQCIEQHGTAEAYLAMIEALGALCRSTRGSAILAGLVRYAPTFLSQVPHLLSDAQLEEVQKRARGGTDAKLVRELCEALEVISGQDPVVLVLEDLQWSDVATIDLLSLLAQRAERAKLLVIGTSRHSEIQSVDHPLNRVMRTLVARSGALAIPVDKIADASVEAFIGRRFPGHQFPPQLAAVVAAITGGVPLFMVSLLDDLARRDMLVEVEGVWTLQVSIEEIAAHRPDSVKQLIDMQLDRLSAGEQRILEAASIMGSEATTGLIAAALDLPLESADESCTALARRTRLLRDEGMAERPDGAVYSRYAMTHSLVQEVCAQRSAPARRQRWHKVIAETLEREHGARSTEVSHTLALHFDAAQLPAKAVHYYMVAGDQTALRLAATDAVTSFARALELIPRLTKSIDRDILELQVLGTVGQLLIRCNTDPIRRDPFELHGRMVELARSLHDVPRLFAALADLCVRHLISGGLPRAASIAEELATLTDSGVIDPMLVEYGSNARALTAYYQGDLRTSRELYASLAASTAHNHPDVAPVHRSALDGPVGRNAIASGRLALLSWLQGRPDEALAGANRSVEIALQLEDPIVLGVSRSQRIRILYLRRDPLDEIEAAAQELVTSGSAGRWVTEQAQITSLLASSRHTPLAEHAARELVTGYHERLARGSLGSSFVAMPLTELLHRSGYPALAREVIELVLAHSLTSTERVYLPELLRLRGLLLEATDRDAARAAYVEARDLARELHEAGFEQRAAASLAALS